MLDRESRIDAEIFQENDVTQKIGNITTYKASKDSKTFKLKANHTYYISVAKSYDFDYTKGKYSLRISGKK